MIKTFDYLSLLPDIEDDVIDAVRRVLHSGQLLLGTETKQFEEEFAQHVGANHCLGVSSGTTAIHLALLALGIGADDEVITVSNTCTPTISAIELVGAKPVFVDVNDHDLMLDTSKLSEALTEKTRCIIVVHLWGQCADITDIVEFAKVHKLRVIEDCAQAQGTYLNGQHAGTFGDVGCFSFYPTKNLGAYGDAGAVVCNDQGLYETLERKRMYGYSKANYAVETGMNARISEMQAAILRIKLEHLNSYLQKRQDIASFYDKHINNPTVLTPYNHPKRKQAYHQYVVRCKDRQSCIDSLVANNVGYGIHYAVPVHMMSPYTKYVRHDLTITEQAAEQILSLPIQEALSDNDIEKVVDVINNHVRS